MNRRDFLILASAAGAGSALCFSSWVLARLARISRAARESHVPPPEPWGENVAPLPTPEPDVIIAREPLKIAKRDTPTPYQGIQTRPTAVFIQAKSVLVTPGKEPEFNPPPTLELVMPEWIRNLGKKKGEEDQKRVTAATPTLSERVPAKTVEPPPELVSATSTPALVSQRAPTRSPPELVSTASTPAPGKREEDREKRPVDLAQSVLAGQKEVRAWLQDFARRADSGQNVSEGVNPRPLFLDRKVEGIQTEPVDIVQGVPKWIQGALSGLGISAWMPEVIEIHGLGYRGLPRDISINPFLKQEAEALGIACYYGSAWGHPGLFLHKENLLYIIGFMPQALQGEGKAVSIGEHFNPCEVGCRAKMEEFDMHPEKGLAAKTLFDYCVAQCKKQEPGQIQAIVVAYREHVQGEEIVLDFIN